MTYQRPAYEQVTLEHDGNAVILRPSLRAAVTLEARFGFPAMFRALEEGNLTIISEIILAASSPATDGATFLHLEAAGRSLNSFFRAVVPPLAELISMFMPAPDPKAKAVPGYGKPMPWPDVYRELYRTATGWLGWTPAEAWAATPTEINEAFAGHVAKLKAMNGSGEEDKQNNNALDPEQAARNEADGLDPEFDRNALRALKAKLSQGN